MLRSVIINEILKDHIQNIDEFMREYSTEIAGFFDIDDFVKVINKMFIDGLITGESVEKIVWVLTSRLNIPSKESLRFLNTKLVSRNTSGESVLL